MQSPSSLTVSTLRSLGDDQPITVTSDVLSEEELVPFSYYVNQIHEEDAFLRSLIQALEACGEPTVLVLYGDHLPSLSAAEEHMAEGALLQTEYVIWDNIGLEKQDQDLEAYQLSSSVLKKLDVRNGVLNSFHQSFEETPAIRNTWKCWNTTCFMESRRFTEEPADTRPLTCRWG